MDGIKQVIIDFIERTYHCRFIGDISVDKKDNLYTMKIFLHNEYFGAYVLAKQCSSDEEFLEYVKKELQSNLLIRSSHSKLIIYPYEYIQEC